MNKKNVDIPKTPSFPKVKKENNLKKKLAVDSTSVIWANFLGSLKKKDNCKIVYSKYNKNGYILQNCSKP